jgi:glycosyltransferase involved in cell wall biosynthesis
LQLISEYQLQKKVIFLHNIENSELPVIYRSATLFVYPSLFEGFGIPILEALTSGVPVITSKGSCFEETGGKAARYIAHDDVEELSHSIREIIGNDTLAQEMIKAGQQHAELFSDENIANSLMQLYNSIN